MSKRIAHITLLVKDYDEAITFYVDKLGFTLVEDTRLSSTKRWVVIAPSKGAHFSLLLAKAVGDVQKKQIGNQAGGRVFLFLYTDNFQREYQNLLAHNITIIREPKIEPYGQVLVFEDLYGNLVDLIEPTAS